MQLLEAETHALRLESRAKDQSGKGTGKSYGRHVNSYQAWWDQHEVEKVLKDPRLVAIPALPITAAKVAMFLQYESTREKVCTLRSSESGVNLFGLQKKRGTTGETIAGSSIGKSQISQVISALESLRSNAQHEYKSCPDEMCGLVSYQVLGASAGVYRFTRPRYDAHGRCHSVSG
ncbi:hypothetical protein C8R43DRAFT_885108 [Mycena crocata]|nr:hypothetical protein C8R43DRAFT_885108 [Mycena crocata]